MQLRVDSHNPLHANDLLSHPETLIKDFIPQWLQANDAAPLRHAKKHAAFAYEAIQEGEPLKDDLWGFSSYWYQIRKKYPTVEQFYALLQERHEAIRKGIESYRPRIEAAKSAEQLYALLASLSIDRGENGNYLIDSSRLQSIYDGVSGSYFLLDENGDKKFVVKPIDEDCGCLNNPKGFATPFDSSPIRNDMPLYLSSLREALTYEIAQSIGVFQVTPKTILAILESDKFSYLIDRVSSSEMERYLEQCGPDLREKLCSLQEYVKDSKTLFEALQDLQQAGLSNEEIANRFDQRDIEDANILIWTTYDTDAHGGNILVYSKGIDAIGNEILGIKKIDNGLAFPDKNTQLRNALNNLPNAKRPLSEEGKAKIAALDIDALAKQLESHGLDSAVPALRTRLAYLKELAQKPDITLYEINKEMSKIGKK